MKQPGRDILILGSPSVSQIVKQHDLVDSFWIFVNPVIFGQGIPLCKGSLKRAKLILRSMKRFSNGEIALHYVPDRVFA
jgi:dihydrofolate reductase